MAEQVDPGGPGPDDGWAPDVRDDRGQNPDSQGWPAADIGDDPAPDTWTDDGSWDDERVPRGVFAYRVLVAGVAAALLGAGLWAYLSVPPALALGQPGLAVAPAAMDAASGMAATQISGAAGRTLDTVAAQVSDVALPTDQDPETAGGQADASTDYAEILAELEEAERAAAQQLAISEQEAATAQEERKRAEKELASEEAAAAKEIDNAIAAAITAAEAQTTADGAIALVDPTVPAADPAAGGTATVPSPADQPATSGGAVPTSGAAIDTAGVLALVRKYFPANEVGNAMAVARCESGHRNLVGAVNGNGTRDFGVFQINDGGTLQAALRRINEPYSTITQAREKALNAELNVRMSRVLWDSRGWQPWVCAAKMKVVSGLYQRSPGPMYGKYNDLGQAN